ncbi:hypothetical protein DSECCO2_603020 [anaerobic digester metagenome]
MADWIAAFSETSPPDTSSSKDSTPDAPSGAIPALPVSSSCASPNAGIINSAITTHNTPRYATASPFISSSSFVIGPPVNPAPPGSVLQPRLNNLG